MSASFPRRSATDAIALVAMLACGVVLAQQSRVVADTVVNVGIVPARSLTADPAERAQHGDALDGGAQHLLVSVADAATGQYVADARVSVAVRDPAGRVQEKTLVPGKVGTIPDYSGLFAFGWSGPYRVHVSVDAGPGKRVETDFTLAHAVR